MVQSLQTLLTNGAPGEWGTTPRGIDGLFGPHTKASVEAFQLGVVLQFAQEGARIPVCPSF